MGKTVLFICTGNYYRSRFAEAYFNHLAEERGLKWRAFSRGLAIHQAPADPPLSPFTREKLEALRIDFRHTAERSVALLLDDLITASLVVALQDTEHRPMFLRQFPDWIDKITFWEVPDAGFLAPPEALAAIQENVEFLMGSVESNAGL